LVEASGPFPGDALPEMIASYLAGISEADWLVVHD
jgi:hypothetical protein